MINPQTTEEQIRAVGKLLEDPSRRCVGRYALSPADECRYGDEPDACKFCLIGAMQRVTGLRVPLKLMESVRERLGSSPIYNLPQKKWDLSTDEGREAIVQELLR